MRKVILFAKKNYQAIREVYYGHTKTDNKDVKADVEYLGAAGLRLLPQAPYIIDILNPTKI